MVDTSAKPELGYWKIRGLAAPIRYQLAYCGVDFKDTEYEQLVKPEGGFDMSAWTDVKYKMDLDFPNLPYFIDGDVNVTETLAIHRYISNKYDPKLCGSTPEVTANVDMMANIIHEWKFGANKLCYGDKSQEDIAEISRAKAGMIEKWLENKKFCAGDSLTWVDFDLFEACEFFEFLFEGKFYTEFPGFKAYHDRIGELPKLKEYISTAMTGYTFNNKSSKVNN